MLASPFRRISLIDLRPPECNTCVRHIRFEILKCLENLENFQNENLEDLILYRPCDVITLDVEGDETIRKRFNAFVFVAFDNRPMSIICKKIRVHADVHVESFRRQCERIVRSQTYCCPWCYPSVFSTAYRVYLGMPLRSSSASVLELAAQRMRFDLCRSVLDVTMQYIKFMEELASSGDLNDMLMVESANLTQDPREDFPDV